MEVFAKCCAHKIRSIVILLMIFIVIFFVTMPRFGPKMTTFFYDEDDFQLNLTLETKGLASDWLINTEGCKILDVDPFHDSIKKHLTKQKPFTCPKNITDGLVYIANQTLFINATVKNASMEYYNSSSAEQFSCCVDFLKRFSVDKSDYTYRKSDKCTNLKKSIPISSNFMKIQCFINKTLIYENFEVVFLRKPDVEARCKTALENAQGTGEVCEDRLSVLMLGLDSTSRLNFQRQLPKSYSYLVNDLNAVEFLGYNKVGANTLPSLLPLLTGYPMNWGTDGPCTAMKTFDNCIFLMDTFAANGYRTCFVEDVIGIATLTYAVKGFRRQPADYYGGLYFGGIRSRELKSKCLQGKSEDELVVTWAERFQQEFVNDSHFGFFWMNQFSHDYLNGAQQIDPFLSGALRRMAENRLLNNTMLIVLSDHGMRHGAIMSTPMGPYELHLPFMAVVFPEWFRKKYARATKTFENNARHRLTTLFDMHHTLGDVARCTYRDGRRTATSGLGQSLFEEISPFRNCKSAEIPHQFCDCFMRRVDMDKGSSAVTFMSALLIQKLNNATAHVRKKCAKLKMTSVDKAVIQVPPTFPAAPLVAAAEERNENAYYYITVSTEPGKGIFKSIFRFNGNTGRYEHFGEIERASRYGNSSACIDEKALKPICYCEK